MQKIPFCLFTYPQKGKKVVWEITSQCNMFCKHCCSNASPQNTPLNKNEFVFSHQNLIKQRINEMISFGIKEFYISGGEPFLVRNLFTILKYLKRKNVKVSIATNSYFLNEEIVKKLSKTRVNFLHISIDGHFPKIHNALRGGKFFNRIIKNIKIVKNYGIPIRIGCIIWRENEAFLEEMVKLCINLGVEELRFSWLIKVGRFRDNPQLYPKRRWLSIMKEIEGLKEKYKYKIRISIHRMHKIKSNQALRVCPGGRKLFFLNPAGELSSCSWIAKIDSNFLTKDSLKGIKIQELASAKEILEFKEMIKRRKNRNFQGCPFMTKYQNSSYYSNDNLLK